MVAAAKSEPHCTPVTEPSISPMIRGAVFARVVVKSMANRYSFQAKMMTKVAVAMMPWVARGRTIRARICGMLAPSM